MTAPSQPDLIGLVLAGGRSLRMGTDKGGLSPHGVPQAGRCRGLLAPHCRAVFFSVRKAQAGLPPYRGQPLIVDAGPVQGPAAGLLAAWAEFPDCALLVAAVDLVLLDDATLAHLVRHRNAAKIATAYRHPSGVIEPLCAIWEPAARASIGQRAGGGSPSLRRVLEDNPVELLTLPAPERLASCNTPEAYAAALAALERG